MTAQQERERGPGQPRLVVRADAWLECDGRLWLGAGRADLLEEVGRHGSISAAARAVGMSYRRAWSLVARMNEMAEEPLVETRTGGNRGGGARITPAGEEAVRLFRRMEVLLADFHRRAADQLSAERERARG